MSALDDARVIETASFREDAYSRVDARTREIVEQRQAGTIRRRGWLVRRLLLAADLLGLAAAMVLAESIVTGRSHEIGVLGSRAEIAVFVLSLPIWVVIAKLYGLYDRDEERTDHSTADDFAGVFHIVTVCTFLFWAFANVTNLAEPTPPKLLIFWAAAVMFVSLGRAGARALARRSVAYLQNTVIVGAGDVGQLIAKKLQNHPEYGINLVGFVDAEPKEMREGLEHFALLGSPERLPALIGLLDIERIVVAFSNESDEEALEVVRSLRDFDVQVDIVPRLFELVSPGVGIHTVEGLPLIGLAPSRLSPSSRLLKRTIDLALTIPVLIMVAPLFALVAFLIKFDSRGPVFFRQVRMGSRDQTFRIWKFRTMVVDADARKHEVAHLNKHARNGGDPRMFKAPDDPRITRVGRWLRRYSLDELPQVVNVLAGQMSFVGPRPLILAEDKHVEEWARCRLRLKPGMTGIWQVAGRDDIPFEEMTRLDYLYVTSWSLFGDFRLILRTVPVLFRSRGVR